MSGRGPLPARAEDQAVGSTAPARGRPTRVGPRHLSLGLVLAAVILTAQFGNSALQHLGNTRYFAWAPNDYMVTYDLQVSVDGRSLTRDEIGHRYRLDLTDRLPLYVKTRLGLSQSEHYVWEDPPQHLLDRITWYERSYGAGHHARVNLIYQLDGGRIRDWRWPT